MKFNLRNFLLLVFGGLLYSIVCSMLGVNFTALMMGAVALGFVSDFYAPILEPKDDK